MGRFFGWLVFGVCFFVVVFLWLFFFWLVEMGNWKIFWVADFFGRSLGLDFCGVFALLDGNVLCFFSRKVSWFIVRRLSFGTSFVWYDKGYVFYLDLPEIL